MRYITLLVCCFAAIAVALPEPVAGAGAVVVVADKDKREALPAASPSDDMPILDTLIESHEKERRTANLSPHNNAR